MDDSSRHLLWLRWGIVFAAILVGLFTLWRLGLTEALWEADPSRLSFLIIAVFLLATLDAGRRAWWMSRELDRTSAVRRLLERHPDAVLRVDRAGVQLVGVGPLPAGVCASHVGRVLRRARGSRIDDPGSGLVEGLSERVRGPLEFGWLVSDVLIKLGLLGTVIGFILMLGSVPDAGSLDVSRIQQVLSGMSGGMRVALFTTVAGLVSGTLLAIQYHLIDRGAGRLLTLVLELAETELAGRGGVGEGVG